MQSNCTKATPDAEPGQNTQQTGGIGAHQTNTTNATKFMSRKQEAKVFFKHKYITQSTLMQADIIVKALDDLTHALKGRKNVKGDTQIEALEQIGKLLNNIPRKVVTQKEQHVTFDENTAPPRETNATPRTLTATQRTATQKSIEKATMDKPILNQSPTPRVQTLLEEEVPTELKVLLTLTGTLTSFRSTPL